MLVLKREFLYIYRLGELIKKLSAFLESGPKISGPDGGKKGGK